MPQEIVKTTDLSKVYPMGEHRIQALTAVDLTVSVGEFVAVMGPSGSGKTTLLDLIGGLEGPSSGEISLAGQILTTLTDDETTVLRRREVGYVFQFFNLLPTLTVLENTALPLLLDGKKLAGVSGQAVQILEEVGLGDRIHHKPHQLSGGEQQRVAFARALVTKPTIILADEPTGNLDATSSTALLNLLRQLCDQQDQTIVMVTHDPKAASFADRVIFLRDGQIVRDLSGAATALDEIVKVISDLEAS